jgi:hypothetical protein
MPIRCVCLALTCMFMACSTANQTPSDPAGDGVVFTGNQKSDWDQIVALENQAKALVKTDGCSSADQCRTAPVGSRACGGPRYYLVYCARTTDTAALFKKLQAVATAEQEYNRRYQLASTCEFRMPPQVSLVGNSCQSNR